MTFPFFCGFPQLPCLAQLQGIVETLLVDKAHQEETLQQRLQNWNENVEENVSFTGNRW